MQLKLLKNDEDVYKLGKLIKHRQVEHRQVGNVPALTKIFISLQFEIASSAASSAGLGPASWGAPRCPGGSGQKAQWASKDPGPPRGPAGAPGTLARYPRGSRAGPGAGPRGPVGLEGPLGITGALPGTHACTVVPRTLRRPGGRGAPRAYNMTCKHGLTS